MMQGDVADWPRERIEKDKIKQKQLKEKRQ